MTTTNETEVQEDQQKCLEELNAVLKKYSMRLQPTFQLLPVVTEEEVKEAEEENE